MDYFKNLFFNIFNENKRIDELELLKNRISILEKENLLLKEKISELKSQISINEIENINSSTY